MGQRANLVQRQSPAHTGPCAEMPVCACVVWCVCLGAGQQRAGGVFQCKRKMIFEPELLNRKLVVIICMTKGFVSQRTPSRVLQIFLNGLTWL